MTSEIKHRIEQIHRGEVPEGYKRTDLGIIPEEWVDSSIGEIITFHGEKSTVNNEHPVLTSARSGLVLQTKYFEGQVTREENAGYNVIPFGYITYRSRSDDGRFTFNQNRVIDKGIVSCFYPVFRVKENSASSKFVLEYLNNCLRPQIVKEIVGTSQLVLSEKKLSELRLPIPPLPEQQKIAEILSTCDKVIDLKQKLIEELQRLKKLYLKKMFPQKGKVVPEIRFPGFTEPWEQHKLGEVVNVCSGRDYKHLTEGTIPVYGTGGYMLSVSEALSYDQDAIGIGRKGTIDKPYVLKAPFWTVDTLFYAVPEHPECLNFVYDIFQIVDWKKKDESTGVPSLSKEAINNTDIMIPQDEEQLVIGEFFARLDNLITLHQRELEEEQQKKKALMQLLLTGLVRVKV